MKRYFYFLVITTWFFSCNRSNTNDKKEGLDRNFQSGDTTINSSVVIVVSPSDNKIRELKAKHGEEDFYIIADDANGYTYEITTMLDEQRTMYFNTDKTLIHFPEEDFSINVDTINKCNWIIIDYKKGLKPNVYCPIDFLSKYSIKKQSALNLDGTWITECSNSNSLYMDVSGAQINFVEMYSLHGSVEMESDTSVILKYEFPTSVIPSPNTDWDHFSKDSVIAKLVLTDKGKLKFYWFGIFNTATNQRELLESGFDNKLPNVFGNLIKSEINCQ